MPTNVVMPQMGESIAEGTIVRWIKKLGDNVDRDEPLFEISTDKVDAEIPAPAAGVLTEIKVKEGETVPVNSVVAVIGEAGGATAAPPPPPSAPVGGPVAPAAAPGGAPVGKPVAPPAPIAPVAPRGPVALSRPWSASEARELRLSPLVRKIAKEHHIDVRNIAGSGSGGRITKADILGYIDACARANGTSALPPAPCSHHAAPAPLEGVDRVPMTVERRRIAGHTVMHRR